MKNSNKVLFFCFLLFSCFSISSASAQTEATGKDVKPMQVHSETNGCELKVFRSDGGVAQRLEVKTVLMGGEPCEGQVFLTDQKGVANLTWDRGCRVAKVIIRGKEFDVEYRPGGMYTINF